VHRKENVEEKTEDIPKKSNMKKPGIKGQPAGSARNVMIVADKG
jgi:hypothetical protein